MIKQGNVFDGMALNAHERYTLQKQMEDRNEEEVFRFLEKECGVKIKRVIPSLPKEIYEGQYVRTLDDIFQVQSVMNARGIFYISKSMLTKKKVWLKKEVIRKVGNTVEDLLYDGDIITIERENGITRKCMVYRNIKHKHHKNKIAVVDMEDGEVEVVYKKQIKHILELGKRCSYE